MFRQNQSHLQQQMLTAVDTLPQAQFARLESSWAGAFYREFFVRIDELPYAVLFSAKDSRPNIPINVLVALEVLKAGFNWSDEDLHDAFCFNLQVRHALGYRTLGDGHFTLRTVYNFRHRLSVYAQRTGTNLFEQSFEQIADGQMAAFKVKTGKVRMDSSQIASNIRNFSRLHLLVEVLHRVHRILSEQDRTRLAEVFAPYLKGNASQYVYRVKSDEGAAHMQRLGDVMQGLLTGLAAAYGERPAYHMLQRVFTEHFLVEPASRPRPGEPPPETGESPSETGGRLKTGKELRADSLQSPDDPEASFRTKNGGSFKGYAVNITETCDPDNELQLIAKVQTQPNVTNDDDLLIAAIPSLTQRLHLQEVYTDGGYNSAESATLLREQGITHVQTAIRGHAPHRWLGLDTFTIDGGEPDGLRTITCPGGQTVTVERVVSKHELPHYRAYFDAQLCQACPLQDRCRVSSKNSISLRRLSFDYHDVEIARRRQRIVRDHHERQNLRVAVESTIGSLKQPYNYGQLPVRGQFRINSLLLGGAAMANVRRIHRYLTRTLAQDQSIGPRAGNAWHKPALLSRFWPTTGRLLRTFSAFRRQSHPAPLARAS